MTEARHSKHRCPVRTPRRRFSGSVYLHRVCWTVIFMAALCLAQATTAAADDEPTFVEFGVPTPLFLSEERLDTLADRIATDMSSAKAFAQIRAEADASLEDEPRPIPVIHYEGHVSNHPDRLRSVKHLQDMRKLRALTWAYAVTGESRYREKARAFLNAWVSTIQPSGNDVNDNKLHPILLALHTFGDELPDDERVAAEAWAWRLAAKHLAELTPERAGGGNRQAKRIKLVAMAGAALDDHPLKWRAMRETRAYIDASLRPDGTSKDLEERDALHYHVSGLSGPLKIMAILRAADGEGARGTELYAYETPEGDHAGASVARGIAYLLPYARGEQVHHEWVHTTSELDRRRAASGDPYYQPGTVWEPSRAADMLLWASAFDPSLRDLSLRLQPFDAANDDENAGDNRRWLAILLDVAFAREAESVNAGRP